MPTFWKYLREQLPAQIATFWMIAAFYILGAGLIYAFLQIDAEFSRPLAGNVVPPEVTQQLAWAVRAFSVIVGMAAMYCHVHGMPRFRWVLTGMGLVAAILLFLHAYGISAKIMEGQYGRAEAITQIEVAATDTTATQIATLQAQIDAIREDRNRQVDRLQVSINGILNDGLNNDHLADAYRADQIAAEEDARARIRPLEDQIATLTERSGTAITTATQAKTETDAFNPLFTFMARVWTGAWDPAESPTDRSQFIAGVAFFTLFFGFGEILMMMCFPIAYGMQLIVAKQKADAPKAEIVPPVADPQPAPMTPSEKGRKGAQAANLNRKANRMDTRIPVGEPEGVAA